MKRCFLLLNTLLLMSCVKTVSPSIENINTIFASQDFTFAFYHKGTMRSFSFMNDVLVYKSDAPTYRREITYNEVVLINRYIQEIVNAHDPQLTKTEHPYYVVKNTAYKVTIVPDQGHLQETFFKDLLKKLQLDEL